MTKRTSQIRTAHVLNPAKMSLLLGVAKLRQVLRLWVEGFI